MFTALDTVRSCARPPNENPVTGRFHPVSGSFLTVNGIRARMAAPPGILLQNNVLRRRSLAAQPFIGIGLTFMARDLPLVGFLSSCPAADC
jgi:hypothetical protein